MTPRPLWKKALLGLVLAGIVFSLGLLALEGALRLFGYGVPTSFHRAVTDAQGRRWWRENPFVTAPYFAPELRRRPQVFRLPVEKAPRTYRVFVLGSSAAMGDPEPAFALSRQLEVLLRAAYPEVRFEVVNAGITAINSHVVRAVAADCAELQPDLFVVYEGNNEVIGPFGPGTVFTPFLRSSGAIRAATWLRRMRTGQLLAATARGIGRNRTTPQEWGGMQMFLQHEIAADDPRLATTRELFRENLAGIAAAGRDAGAQVLLCTVLTNQRDFPPFLSRHRTGLAADELRDWQGAVEAARRALAGGRTAQALAHYGTALGIDDRFAELHYEVAKLHLREQQTAGTKKHFQRALDLDALRFRTDSALNDVIRSFAKAGDAGVQVVDLAAAAEAATPDGVLGNETLFEHVHLTFNGTSQAARTLFTRVSEDLKRRKLIASAAEPSTLPDAAVLRARLAYSTIEQLRITEELLARCRRAPFTQQSNNDQRLAVLSQRLAAAQRDLARPEAAKGLGDAYEWALAAAPDDWLLRRNAGLAFGALGQLTRARELLLSAAAEIPDDPDTLWALANAHRQLGDTAKADAALATLREIEPNFPALRSSAK